jgi:sterol desaturase/sphingolipid hydroxylase (fatty acid hydroxylase superfamily)
LFCESNSNNCTSQPSRSGVLDDLPNFLLKIIAPFFYPLAPFTRVFWLHLIGALFLAYLVYRIARKKQQTTDAKPHSSISRFFRFCFPKDVYGHASAVVDYKFYIVNRIAHAFIFAPLFLGAPLVAGWVVSLIEVPVATTETPGLFAVGILTITAVIAFDLGIFIAHFLQHKIPLLWEFHKVHHSAQVLTPITVYRMHPVDELLTGISTALTVGTTTGVITSFMGAPVEPWQFFQVNAVLFLYYFAGYNLRHTHIWLNYPRAMLRVLISPAQHQIHHSRDAVHFDKNLGFMFSFWDRIAGTLYIPETKEELTFGLSDDEDRAFDGVLALYFRPFAKAAALLRRISK